MMKNAKFCFYFLTFFFVACGKIDSEREFVSFSKSGNVNIEPFHDPKVIELDRFSGKYYEISGLSKDHEYYFYNTYNQSLYIYDLTREPSKPKNILRMPFDETLHFLEASDIVYHNTDSIFVWDKTAAYKGKHELFLMNSRGEMIDSFKVLNSANGEPAKAESFHTSQGSRSMLFHDGKIMLLSAISQTTSDENLRPIIVFDIKDRVTSFHGGYPDYFEKVSFGRHKWMSNFCLIPELNQVVVSFPFESNFFLFNTQDFSWQELEFKSELVQAPAEMDYKRDNQEFYYQFTNSWFYGLHYDASNGLIWRGAQIGQKFSKNDPLPLGDHSFSYPSLNNDGIHFYTFLIDLNTKTYRVLPDFNWLKVRFFHPVDGPYMIEQRHAELGLSVEDFLIFSPLVIKKTN